MKEIIYNIFRILGIIGLAFCIFFLLISYIWDFGGGIGEDIFLLINLAYIVLLIVAEFSKKINANTSLIIWVMFISYIIYLYSNKILGTNMVFMYIIIGLILAAFGTYKLKKKEEINTNKSTNIKLIIIAVFMIIYMFISSFLFLKWFNSRVVQSEEDAIQILSNKLNDINLRYDVCGTEIVETEEAYIIKAYYYEESQTTIKNFYYVVIQSGEIFQMNESENGYTVLE